MRRAAFAVVTGLMLVALVAPVVSAARPAASFVGKASAAAPGGTLQIVAKVKHAVRGSDFSATATVHFASGDVRTGSRGLLPVRGLMSASSNSRSGVTIDDGTPFCNEL